MEDIGVMFDDFGNKPYPQALGIHSVQAGRYDGITNAHIIFPKHEVQVAAIC